MSSFESALGHFQTCLFQRRKLLGSHVDVANTLYEMATIFNGQERKELAVECMLELDSIWKTKLRNSKKFTSVLLLSANLWKSLQCYQPAENNYEQALQHAISIHGQQHETVASILLSLGDLLQEIDQNHQALFCFDESIKVRTALYGPDSLGVAQVEYNKGVALLFHGDFAEASISLERALTIQQENLGCMDETVGDTLNAIGVLQLRMGYFMSDKAMAPLTKALQIRRTVGKTSKVVSTLQNIASVYRKRKQQDSWIETHTEMLIVRQEEFGFNSSKTSEAWISLGNAQISAGRLEEATISYSEALKIQTLIHGLSHRSVAQILFKMGSLNTRQSKFTVAKQLFKEYMRIRADEEDDPDEEMAQALTLMGDLQMETGEKSKAQINWSSALDIYHQLGYPGDHPKLSKLISSEQAAGLLFGFPRRWSRGEFSLRSFISR
jgi:tetratricopeptide (TPR) repeat protein